MIVRLLEIVPAVILPLAVLEQEGRLRVAVIAVVVDVVEPRGELQRDFERGGLRAVTRTRNGLPLQQFDSYALVERRILEEGNRLLIVRTEARLELYA